MNQRNIKNGLYGWYEKEAMKKIETLPFGKQAACKLIYIALCSISAKNKNQTRIECYRFDISRYSSLSDRTVRRYINLLEELKIITIEPQDRQSDGKYKKAYISLLSTNSPSDTSWTDRGQIVDTESDILNKEIKEINNIYIQKFSHPITDFIMSEKMESVLKLEKQLTEEQCNKLMAKYDLNLIKSTLASMENWKDLKKKNKGVFTTLCNWANKSLSFYNRK